MVGVKSNSQRTSDTRPTLSSRRILTAAVSRADHGGLAGVSMRGLARELGVTPMALYWHFADKDALVDAMVELVVEEAHFGDVPGGTWQERYRGVLTTLVEVLQAHPWVGRLVIERLVLLPNYLGALEILLDALRQAGLPPQEGAVLVQQSVQTVASLVEFEPAATPDDDCREEQKLTDLPADQYPNVRAAAVPLGTPGDPQEYYRLGLDTIIGGIVAIADR